MHFRQIYPLIAVFLVNALCHGEEFIFNVSSYSSPHCTPIHWRHHATNSAIEIEGVEIDIFQWRAAADDKKYVQVDIINPVWNFAGWADQDFVLPDIIDMSEVVSYRSTPTVYIQVIPWRVMDGRIEVLTQGKIQISVEPVDFPITYSHPYLLNGDKRRLKREFSNDTEYLIICPSRFENAAQSLAKMHSDSVDFDYRLNTEVIVTDDITTDISGLAIRNYIIDRINDDLDPNSYLLLFGDEIDIPPIIEDDYPSDDFYSTVNIYSGDPQLFCGRIPVSTENEAWAVVEKIKQYTLHPTPGIWRSKVALVADDMYKTCSYKSGENSHTDNSDEIYDSLRTLLPVQPFYGVNYGLQSAGSGCEHPDLTKDLIRTINNGVALINYIGHGDPETWAGEKIITKSRDLPLIHADNGKLAIWVAGTCSFGKYHSENSFMEELLIKKDGAIALVATTDQIGYIENSNYLNNLFGLSDSFGIKNIVRNGYNIRLGELILNSKNGNYHKFHTFGDPALRLPFPSRSEDIFDPPDEIPIIEERNMTVDGASSNSTLLIRGNDKDITYDYGSDSLIYTVPGPTYAQVDFNSITCYRIPLDAGACDNCAVIQVYQDEDGWNGKIQTSQDISIISSDAAFQDEQGPKIIIFQGNNPIWSGSALLTNTDLTISLIDTSGINLMETIGHGIRYAYDDDNLTLLPGSEFSYGGCDSGSISIPVPSTLYEGLHHFYLEAWDGVNNKSTVDIRLEILGNSSNSPRFLYNVYPIPSPFSVSTEFTMFVSDPPASIAITVYSLMGDKVRELVKDPAEESFISIQWNGKDQAGRKIANGAYFYHVKAEKDGNIMFEDIFKLAKVE